jgi:hypothetical protein
LQLQVRELIGRQLEEKVRREPRAVTTYLLIQSSCCDPVQGGEVSIKQYALTAQDKDLVTNVGYWIVAGPCH